MRLTAESYAGIVGATIVDALAPDVQAQSGLVDDFQALHTCNFNVGGGKLIGTGAQHRVGGTREQLHIFALDGAPHGDGRNGVIIAVDGVCQVVEAQAAVGDLGHGNGRHYRQHRQRTASYVEVQIVGDEGAVGLQTLQLQFRLGLYQGEQVQLQIKCVTLLPVKGVDGAFHLCQIHTNQLGCFKAAGGPDTIDREGSIFQPISQFLHVEGSSVKDGGNAHLAGKTQVARHVRISLPDHGGGIRDIQGEDGAVFLRLKAHGHAVGIKAQGQPPAILGRIELEGGGIEAESTLGDLAVGCDGEGTSTAPCGGDRGGQRHSLAGKFIGVGGISPVLLSTPGHSGHRIVAEVYLGGGFIIASESGNVCIAGERRFDLFQALVTVIGLDFQLPGRGPENGQFIGSQLHFHLVRLGGGIHIPLGIEIPEAPQGGYRLYMLKIHIPQLVC